jgi:PIN domain nuclease of toxin-antitoxin system
MRLLLDSHTVYWWMIGSPRLSTPARALIVDKGHAVRVSAASIYELEFKARRRRIELPPQELRAALRRNAVEDLAITLDHAEYAAHLNWAHRDPWDRILAAQARLENCALVSLDTVFDEIGLERLW